MKKVILIFSVLAFTSCKFNENGNKMVLPEDPNQSAVNNHDSDMNQGNHEPAQNNVMTNEIMNEHPTENHMDSIEQMQNHMNDDTMKVEVDSTL